jgi:hypothetical protein
MTWITPAVAAKEMPWTWICKNNVGGGGCESSVSHKNVNNVKFQITANCEMFKKSKSDCRCSFQRHGGWGGYYIYATYKNI